MVQVYAGTNGMSPRGSRRKEEKWARTGMEPVESWCGFSRTFPGSPQEVSPSSGDGEHTGGMSLAASEQRTGAP